jgi:DNA-binding transcriptional ArsR family regulator
MPLEKRAFKYLLNWLFIATRGGTTRGLIIDTILQEPMNTNQIRKRLDLDFKTVKYHLEVLEENGVVLGIGNHYGRLYYPSDKLLNNIELYKKVCNEDSDVLEVGDDEK